MSSTRRAPSPAERARTVLAAASSVRLGVLELAHEVQRHLVAQDGSLLMQPGADSPARVLACGGSVSPWSGTAIAVDVANIAHLDRIRGRVTLTGPVEAIPEPAAGHVRQHLADACPSVAPVTGPVLRLAPRRVVLEWRCTDEEAEPRTTPIPLDAYRAAIPDPFARCADEWLEHLDRTHAPGLRELADRATGGVGSEAVVRPLLVDRFGFVLRVSEPASPHPAYDVRVPFARPVACPCEAADALEELWSRPGSA